MKHLARYPSVLTAGELLLAATMLSWPASAHAAAPRIGFDVSYSVECRDVTPIEFAEANPESKIIEARFGVSALLRRGEEKEIKELMYRIWSPEKRLRVVDFEPKTRVGSEVTDSIAVVETEEGASSLDGSVSVQFSPLAGVHVAPSAGGSKMKKQILQQTYSRLPPKQLLVASGTTNREHGVFFKLKPSSQASLEGQREFVCLFVVPGSWRGDYAYVDCRARSRSRPPWTPGEECGSRRVLVGLYLQGDAEAREAAEGLAHAYEAYLKLDGRAPQGSPEPAKETETFLQRLPVTSLVGSVISDLSVENGKTAKKKDQAWQSFLSALDEIGRFTG